MTLTLALLVILYFAVFVAAIVGSFFFIKRRERPKQPFKKDTRLLRGPGESLLKIINRLDEELATELIFSMGAPILIGAAAGAACAFLKLTTGNGAGWIAILVTFVALLVVSFRLVKKARRRASYYLGYFGERVVGEILETLKQSGWRIFHDVPAESGKDEFNIDHVAIGDGGIFGIETKARRKGDARADREDQKVFYDGKKLMWPWGDEEPYGVTNAIDRAKWLEIWLNQATGERIRVMPVLTFPEWYVKELVVDPRVRVVTSSWLPSVITARKGVLTEQQVDLLARQLEQRCRDVVF